MKGLLSRLARKLAGPGDPVDAPGALAMPDASKMIDEANELFGGGRLADAASIYQRVLALDASNFEALHRLGGLSLQAGDAGRAAELIARAVEVRPDDASARSNLGLVYRSLGRLDDAEATLRRAVQLSPASDRVHASLGVVLRDRGDLPGAEAEFTAALLVNPGNDEAQSNLASVCKELQRYEEAESHFRAALALRPERVEHWTNLAGLCLERGQWSEAETCLRNVREKGAATPEILSHLGFALLQLDRPDEAEMACRDALAMRADYPDALVNLGSVLKALGDLAGAEASCREALAIDAGHVAALVNLASICRERGDVSAAEACCRRALVLDPQSSAARFNLSTILLVRGEYPEGFALAEGRFDTFKDYYRRPYMERLLRDEDRRWRGGPVVGRRVVIWSEQGHGDNLLMLRYLPLLKQQGATRVTFVCDPELVRVTESVEGIDSVIVGEDFDATHAFDLHCPAMSLPHCFQVAPAAVSSPYVAVPAWLSTEWSVRLAAVRHPRVGLVWAGNQVLREHAKRSMSLELMAPLRSVDGVQFFSLQKGEHAAQAGQWGGRLIDHMESCRDFMDTAALIDNLDLVITIDTAVAHLAGAMGRPVWLLNRAESDWRWGLAGECSTLYPSMRIFRQEQPLDWAPVMLAVAGQLTEWVARVSDSNAQADRPRTG